MEVRDSWHSKCCEISQDLIGYFDVMWSVKMKLNSRYLITVKALEKIYSFCSQCWASKFVNIVPADGLAPNGARPSAGAVKTKFSFPFHTWPIFEELKCKYLKS